MLINLYVSRGAEEKSIHFHYHLGYSGKCTFTCLLSFGRINNKHNTYTTYNTVYILFLAGSA